MRLETVMFDLNAEGDAAASLLERRWFASIAAVRAMQAECEVLREVMEMAEDAWRRARNELVKREALRDALGEHLAERDGQLREVATASANRAMFSAA